MITQNRFLCYAFSMIDLHTHSTASDGSLPPSELISYAAAKGIRVLALTDHDTDSGLTEAADAASRADVTFVPGIELNVSWPTGEFHLLGLGLQHTDPALARIIAFLQEGRNNRNSQIIEKMKNDGFDVSLTELQSAYPGAIIGRPHIAEYFVRQKICKNRQQAFDTYLGKGRPYYVERTGADLDDAIGAVCKSGGIPVLAHPLSLYVSWGKMEPVLAELKERGVQGLEAFHPGARKTEALRLEELARKLGYFVTAGSDFHGEIVRKDRKIGHSSGAEKISDRFWTEELEPRLGSARH